MPLFGILSDNNYPGEYASIAREATAITDTKTFDGVNIVYNKTLPGPHEATLTEGLLLSRRGPPVSSTSLQYATDFASASVSADTSKTASATVLLDPFKDATLLLKAIGDTRALNNQLSVLAPASSPRRLELMSSGRIELHLKGGDFALSGLYSTRGDIFAGSLMQSLTRDVCVGGELVHIGQSGDNMYACGARFNRIVREEKGEGFCVTVQGNSEKTASVGAMYQLSKTLAGAMTANFDFKDMAESLRAQGAVHTDASCASASCSSRCSMKRACNKCVRLLKDIKAEISVGVTRVLPRAQVTSNINTHGDVSCDVKHVMSDGTVINVIASTDVQTGNVSLGMGLIFNK